MAVFFIANFYYKKVSHLGGETYQMFSQRNNPYCDFLSKTNIEKNYLFIKCFLNNIL